MIDRSAFVLNDRIEITSEERQQTFHAAFKICARKF